MKHIIPALTLIVALTASSCNSFNHGYTWEKARDRYLLVTGNSKNFGDKRLRYNKGFHRNSELEWFLSTSAGTRGLPGFIYEYKNTAKCRGIKLFYPAHDSAFVFEEPKKNNLRSVMKERRKMDEFERLTYQHLIAENR